MPSKKRTYNRRSETQLLADLESRIATLKQRIRDRDRFSPEDVAADRERLELSAADYAELIGVTQATIYSWEQGRSQPRASQMEKWLAVRGMPRAKAWKKLGISDKSPLWGTGFSAKAVAAERARLELSAADYGELVGVSGLTIYNWEKGKSEPRQAQIEKWLAVKGIGKKQAWKRLGY